MPCIYAVPLPIGRDLGGTTTTRENRAQVIKDSPRPDVFAADKAVGQNFAAGIDNLDAAGQSATDKLTRESKFRISIVADNNLVMKETEYRPPWRTIKTAVRGAGLDMGD